MAKKRNDLSNVESVANMFFSNANSNEVSKKEITNHEPDKEKPRESKFSPKKFPPIAMTEEMKQFISDGAYANRFSQQEYVRSLIQKEMERINENKKF